MPVLPEVGSRIVQPGRSRPAFSACSTMNSAGRSLTEPVGLRSSSLAHSRTSGEGESRGSPTRGGVPTESSSESYRMTALAARDRRQHRHVVAVLDLGLETAQEAHVLVVEV